LDRPGAPRPARPAGLPPDARRRFPPARPPGYPFHDPDLTNGGWTQFSPRTPKERTTMGLNWDNAREIGELLFEKYDTLNPLTVRFTDLHKWILDLEDFEGKLQESNVKRLDAGHM